MTDRAKVIKGLENAKNVIENWIPMFEQYNSPAVIDEAIALLKKQEPKPPALILDAEGIWATCPTCRNKLRAILAMEMNTYCPKFCSECGQAVKWDD